MAEGRTITQRIAIAASMATVVAAGALWASAGGGGPESRSSATAQSTPPSEPSAPSEPARSEAAAATVAAGTPPGWSGLAVGVIERGQTLAVIDTVTGHVVRRLATSSYPESPLAAPALSSDGFVYFVQTYPGDSGSDFLRISLESPAEAEIIIRNVSDVSLAPDNDQLAYVRYVYPFDAVAPTVIVRDLATGAERTWSVDPDRTPRSWVAELRWSPDSTILAFSIGGIDGSDISVGLLDTSNTSSTLQPLFAAGRPLGWLDDRRLVFAETPCCSTWSSTKLRVHDRSTGAAIDLADLPVTPAPALILTTAALDSSGRWLLVTGYRQDVATGGDVVPYTAVFGPLDGDAQLSDQSQLALVAGDW